MASSMLQVEQTQHVPCEAEGPAHEARSGRVEAAALTNGWDCDWTPLELDQQLNLMVEGGQALASRCCPDPALRLPSHPPCPRLRMRGRSVPILDQLFWRLSCTSDRWSPTPSAVPKAYPPLDHHTISIIQQSYSLAVTAPLAFTVPACASILQSSNVHVLDAFLQESIRNVDVSAL